MSLPISVIVLTCNERGKIKACLESACNIFDEIFVVDSGSTDNTLDIARQYTEKIYLHHFTDYASQRNWAQKNLPLRNEWVFHLDADERISPELSLELNELFSSPLNGVSGFLVSRKTIFKGKWIKYGGHYPVYHARIFRRSEGSCEERRYDQHFIILGKQVILKSDIINIVDCNFPAMIRKMDLHSSLEAEELTLKKEYFKLSPDLSGSPMNRRRWLRVNLYEKSPIFIRVFLYFFYRYFIRLGFLGGEEGLVFHFLQGFWYRFLVDCKIYKITLNRAIRIL